MIWRYFEFHLPFRNISIILGVALAIIEKSGMITTYHNIAAGTISAGYQNLLICIEMFFAAVLLKFAFPHNIYRHQQYSYEGGSAALRTISRNFRQTVNPTDIVQDAIHNFSPAYRQYAGANISKDKSEGPEQNGRQAVSYQVTARNNTLDSPNNERRRPIQRDDTAVLLENEEDDEPLLEFH